MATPKKSLTTGLPPRINLSHPAKKPTVSTSLLKQRMRELDREFARQTKQLRQMTKDLAKKLSDKL